jgi:hypothetical protein
VKITVIGRPGKIVDKGTCIVTVMEESRTPALPKGLPTPTSTPTKYAVYIASKQWAKVKDAMADPENVLIAEGPILEDGEMRSKAPRNAESEASSGLANGPDVASLKEPKRTRRVRARPRAGGSSAIEHTI